MALAQVLGFPNPSGAKLLSNATLNHTPLSRLMPSRFSLSAPLMTHISFFLADKPRIHLPSASPSFPVVRAPIFGAHNKQDLVAFLV